MTKTSSNRIWLMVIPLALIILISDQVSKFAIEAKFPTPHNFQHISGFTYDSPFEGLFPPIQVFGHDEAVFAFKFDHVINQGAAWGIFQGKMGPLSVVSAVVFLFLIWYYPKFVEGYRERDISYGLLQGGILGNLIDRVGAFGRPGVVDFLDFRIFSYDFPSFNIADAAICVAVFIYCISSFIRPDPKKLKDQSESTPESNNPEALKAES